MRDTVLFLDTTLRDGEQTPGVSFHLNDKVDFARALETLGVDMIEAGFAGASPGDFEAVRAVPARSKPACALWRAAWRRISAPPPTRSKAPPNPASMSLSPPVPCTVPPS